jgi:cysteine synthase A
LEIQIMTRFEHIHELVGNTPVVKLHRIVEPGMATVFAKLESQNPAGSVKDRIAHSMIEGAVARGELRSGMTIVEATSGNTGIGLALIAASKGYDCILTMPESMTIERRRVLSAYGATVVLTPGPGGMPAAISKAEEISNELGSKAWSSLQFSNSDNPAAHRSGTGPEIMEQVPEISSFVAGVGTGGTVTGAGQFLKQFNPEIRVLAVEPETSPVLSGGEKGPHKIQGIGAGFIPEILDTEIYDQVCAIGYDDAVATARRLAQEEGILSGLSTGAICYAALEEAKRLGPSATVVFIVCDFGERYASHEVFTGSQDTD